MDYKGLNRRGRCAMKTKILIVFVSVFLAVIFAGNVHATKLAPVSAKPTADTASPATELENPSADQARPAIDISRPTVDIMRPSTDTDIVKPVPEFQRPLRELKPMPISDRTTPNKPSGTGNRENAVYMKQK